MEDTEPSDWNQIVECHGERVFRTALRLLGSAADAEDIAQDVFVEALRRRSKKPVRNWAAFLVRMSTLRSIDRIRRRRPSVELRETDRISTVGPFEEVVATELADWLRNSLAGLSDRQATVFVMTHFEGLSRDQIAESLDTSPEAVSTALHKARQRLLARRAVYDSGGTE